MADEYQYQYKNKQVRDLAWTLKSPSLITNHGLSQIKVLDDIWGEKQHDLFKSFLLRLDKTPEILAEAINHSSSHFLGSYFESLVQFWLENDEDYELLDHNVQLIRHKRTIGEFDFIYKNIRNGKVYHLETVVKYYLHFDSNGKNSRGLSNWIGPNPSDRLDKKIDKLFNKQSLLAFHEAGRKFLYDLGIESINPVILFKGYLFYHFQGNFRQTIKVNSLINPSHLRGWWCYPDEIRNINQGPGLKSGWSVIPKIRWLSGEYYTTARQCFTFGQIIKYVDRHFSESSEPVLLIRLDRINDDRWIETDRGFIVSSGWPNV